MRCVQNARKQDIAHRFVAFKKDVGCMACGYNRCSDALAFHHVRDKRRLITPDSWVTGKADDELHKCVIVCFNCHNEIHANLRECPEQIDLIERSEKFRTGRRSRGGAP